MELTKHIHVLPGITNVGLIEADGNLYIIDTGSTREDGLNVLSDIRKIYPEEKYKVKAIINTHSHADHIGGNPSIVEKTGCGVWSTEGEKPSIEYPPLENATVWGGTPPLELQHRFFEAEPSTVTRIIKEYEHLLDEKSIIDIYPISLPGHYFDQTGIFVTDKETSKTAFFMGDAIFGRFRMGKYWIPYLFDVEGFKASLQKIATIKSDFYIPSHGDVVNEITALEELNEFATIETEESIIKILKDSGPLTTEEVLSQVANLNEIPLKIGQYALIGSTLRSYLSYLYKEKRISYFFENNFLKWKAL